MALRSIDLMIGDWVRNDLGEIQRIEEIRQKDVMLSYNDYYSYDEIDQIPLTTEILEKNGFEKKTFYGIYDDYFDFDIREYSDGIYIATYHSCEFNIPDQTIHLSWVHELQHFMRHCGIEKEIEL